MVYKKPESSLGASPKFVTSTLYSKGNPQQASSPHSNVIIGGGNIFEVGDM
jgi:hypothetical protein